MGEGVPCLDMHATDTQAVPGRVQKESVNHHTEFLTNNMYRARSVSFDKKDSCHSETLFCHSHSCIAGLQSVAY